MSAITAASDDEMQAEIERLRAENESLKQQLAQQVPEVGSAINLVVDLAHRKGELWERCQGKCWPEAESDEFTKLRDGKLPEAIAQLQQALISAAPAPQLAQWVRPVQHEIIKIAAECARREPIAAMYELAEATHIGHRQFSRAFDLTDAAIIRVSARLKAIADSLSAAPAQPEPNPKTYTPTQEQTIMVCDLLHRIKESHEYWGGWSGIPSNCELAINLLRYQPDAPVNVPEPPEQPTKECEWTNCPNRAGDVCCNEQPAPPASTPAAFPWPLETDKPAAQEAADKREDALQAIADFGQLQEAEAQDEPVAWRYQDARGHYRYVTKRPDASWAPGDILKPIPLYTRQQHASKPMTEHEILVGWSNSKVCTGSIGSRHQAFAEGVRFAERFHNIKE